MTLTSFNDSFHLACWRSRSIPIRATIWGWCNTVVRANDAFFRRCQEISASHQSECNLVLHPSRASRVSKIYKVTLSAMSKWHFLSFLFSMVSLSAALCRRLMYVSNSAGLSHVIWNNKIKNKIGIISWIMRHSSIVLFVKPKFTRYFSYLVDRSSFREEIIPTLLTWTFPPLPWTPCLGFFMVSSNDTALSNIIIFWHSNICSSIEL